MMSSRWFLGHRAKIRKRVVVVVVVLVECGTYVFVICNSDSFSSCGEMVPSIPTKGYPRALTRSVLSLRR
jgi:hypothetical protein